jgi:glycine/D-amino acid oxidase-like deaminating enzyme
MNLAEGDLPGADAVIIGGGFYGSVIASFLAGRPGMQRVVLLEREPALMTRASRNNQARVHNGYHYPRSLVTANRSRVNLPRFVADWSPAVRTDFTKLYAIARKNSKVTARQFRRFCLEIGAHLEPADPAQRQLFDARLIEDVFIAQEPVFDCTVLAQQVTQELAASGVEVRLGNSVQGIWQADNGRLCLRLTDSHGAQRELSSRWVFNCTYSGLNQLRGDATGLESTIKQEITEMALLDVPPSLTRLGITVMDGPFFSLMPFPSRGLHTLSHVRYTPHLHWTDRPDLDPYQRLAEHDHNSRVDRMLRDAARYLPAISAARYETSLFEVKTVLGKNEVDDGRPILFHRDTRLPQLCSVLGGKIDNIYDILDRISALV